MSSHKRSLRNYVLDRQMQVGYAARVVGVSALIAIALGVLIYQQLARASRIAAQMTADLGVDMAVAQNMAASDSLIIIKMIFVGLGVAVVLGGFLIVMTHKVAGPLHKIAHYFDDMERGVFTTLTTERRGDMLEDFYQDFASTHQVLQQRAATDQEKLRALVAALSPQVQTPEQAAAIARLTEISDGKPQNK